MSEDLQKHIGQYRRQGKKEAGLVGRRGTTVPGLEEGSLHFKLSTLVIPVGAN